MSMEQTTPQLFNKSATRLASLAIVLALIATACGSENVSVGTPSDPDDTPVTSPVDDPNPQPAPDTTDAVPFADVDGTLIGSANMGGEIVDPKRTPIDSFSIAESYPEQIHVEFTGAAEGCTAATAQAFGTDDQVTVVLEVGITTDALVKTCPAGEFTHILSIALQEGLDGRDVVVLSK
ncbi:MAG: hypothetical protein V3V01_20010 [Acidimicrobiales bacterium]